MIFIIPYVVRKAPLLEPQNDMRSTSLPAKTFNINVTIKLTPIIVCTKAFLFTLFQDKEQHHWMITEFKNNKRDFLFARYVDIDNI